MLGKQKHQYPAENKTVEVITLSLTFDHRVVNGPGAANFVHDIKEQIENFKIPAKSALTHQRFHDHAGLTRAEERDSI
ncbi:MAG: hypothetical protein DMF42_01790 [Verrucomicrobia bacterium]|nr:MAG: hypothetical protein DMF42_01790 [Verrucomicrobiota bacterium]